MRKSTWTRGGAAAAMLAAGIARAGGPGLPFDDAMYPDDAPAAAAPRTFAVTIDDRATAPGRIAAAPGEAVRLMFARPEGAAPAEVVLPDHRIRLPVAAGSPADVTVRATGDGQVRWTVEAVPAAGAGGGR